MLESVLLAFHYYLFSGNVKGIIDLDFHSRVLSLSLHVFVNYICEGKSGRAFIYTRFLLFLLINLEDIVVFLFHSGVGKKLLSLIALSLNMDEDFFEKIGAEDKPAAFLRLLHYPGLVALTVLVRVGSYHSIIHAC